MFAFLGRFATRFRGPIVLVWVLAAAILVLGAPNISDVAVNDQRAFLSDDAPSLEAIEQVVSYFPERAYPSNVVLVLDAGEGNQAGAGETRSFTVELTEWLASSSRPDVIDRVVSPVTADEETAKALTSDDGEVTLVIVSFTSTGTEEVTRDALDMISERLEQAPAGLTPLMTGDAAIISAYDEATRQSLDSTTWITILLVVLILLAVYRSPVSPLIPLGTIGISYLISRSIVAFLGDSVMTISGYTNIFLVVILFGAGTDYCLFLISRFREEIGPATDSGAAAGETIRTVGETIASSAGTVVVGLSTMALAELGLFNTTGPSVAIGVVITLVAGLTLVPALLSLLGRRAFWPRKARTFSEGRFWSTWARQVAQHPVLALLITLLLLSPLAVYGQGQERDFDLLGDLPDSMEAHRGFETLSEHIGPGTMSPLTVLLRSDTDFDTSQGLERLQELTSEVANLENVGEARSFTTSLEGSDTLDVQSQLSTQSQAVREGISALEAEGAAAEGDQAEIQNGVEEGVQEAASELQSVWAYLQQLGTEFPEVREQEGYQAATQALSSLARLGQSEQTGNIRDTEVSAEEIQQALEAALRLVGGLEDLEEYFAGRGAIMLPLTYLEQNEGLRELEAAYLAAGGEAARLQVVLDTGPYSPLALDTVETIRNLFAETEGVEGTVEGSSALVADLQAASNRDMTRSVISVLVGIFVVLVLLLRSLVAPIYLILTILLSYGATLGLVKIVFSDIGGATGITWWVPIFMFVMLVALGMDYNIFLMGRVKEEVEKSGNRQGIEKAVARTGGIITSAGIIMAGTFAAMLSARIVGLVQIGFAVAVGVLIDTFIVRTALVPSIALLLKRWGWWPRRID